MISGPDHTVDDAQDSMALTWEQIRLAAGDVQLILMKGVLDHEDIPRMQVPALVKGQKIVEEFVPSGTTNLQDIADRLARADVLRRLEHPVRYAATPRTHRLYDLLAPALNRGRGPVGVRAPTRELTPVTLVVDGPALTAALDDLLSAVRALRLGEGANVQIVRSS